MEGSTVITASGMRRSSHAGSTLEFSFTEHAPSRYADHLLACLRKARSCVVSRPVSEVDLLAGPIFLTRIRPAIPACTAESSQRSAFRGRRLICKRSLPESAWHRANPIGHEDILPHHSGGESEATGIQSHAWSLRD